MPSWFNGRKSKRREDEDPNSTGASYSNPLCVTISYGEGDEDYQPQQSSHFEANPRRSDGSSTGSGRSSTADDAVNTTQDTIDLEQLDREHLEHEHEQEQGHEQEKIVVVPPVGGEQPYGGNGGGGNNPDEGEEFSYEYSKAIAIDDARNDPLLNVDFCDCLGTTPGGYTKLTTEMMTAATRTIPTNTTKMLAVEDGTKCKNEDSSKKPKKHKKGPKQQQQQQHVGRIRCIEPFHENNENGVDVEGGIDTNNEDAAASVQTTGTGESFAAVLDHKQIQEDDSNRKKGINSACSSTLDSIRCMGPIFGSSGGRDGDVEDGEPAGGKPPRTRRYWRLIVAVFVNCALVIIIGTTAGVIVQNKKKNTMNNSSNTTSDSKNDSGSEEPNENTVASSDTTLCPPNTGKEQQPEQEQQQNSDPQEDNIDTAGNDGNGNIPAATTTQDYSEREKEIRAVLAVASPPPMTECFDIATSPQGQALAWLVDEDPAQLSVDTSSGTEVMERFAAATLYFSTGGGEDLWTSSFGFLSAESICNWNDQNDNGIFCDGTGSVTSIKLVENNLKGVIPNEMNYFEDLMKLELYYNELYGAIPDLYRLINLYNFDVDGNALEGAVPASLFNLPNIVNIYLLNNAKLVGSIPEIGMDSKLEKISVLECSFSGTIPNSLSSVSTLRLLQMKNNDVGGTIPSMLLSLPNLETLGLHGNQLVGSIPSIQTDRNEGRSVLRSIALGSNSLEGTLPDGIEQLESLQFLYAQENDLTGEISPEIMDLPLLEQLWLYDNELTGEIPSVSSSNRDLKDLFLNGNDLSGNLQDLLSSVPITLEQLDLSNNNLEDTIPYAIGRLTNLQYLDLSKNNLSGEISEVAIGNLRSLTSFNFSQNRRLVGDLTSSICETNDNLIFAVADCSGNGDPRVDCDCCTECCDRSGECSAV